MRGCSAPPEARPGPGCEGVVSLGRSEPPNGHWFRGVWEAFGVSWRMPASAAGGTVE